MLSQMLFSCTYGEKCEKFSVFKRSGYLERPRAMGKMSLTSCRALSTPGKFSNVDRYACEQKGFICTYVCIIVLSHSSITIYEYLVI